VLTRQDRLDAAEETLSAAIRLEPQNGLVLAMLAELRLKQKRPADAWKVLSGAKPTDDFLSEYTTGHALLDYAREVGWTTADAEQAHAPMRERLLAATRLDATVAEAWHALTHAHLVAGDLPEAEAAITRALELAPARDYYRLALGEVLGRRREFARARAALGTLVAAGRSTDVREHARTLLGIVAEVERAQMEAETARTEQQATSVAQPSESRLMPDFRPVKPGETRVFGRLTGIECTRGAVTLILHTDSDTLRIVVPGFDQVEFITYREDLRGQVSCTKRVPPDPVYVTWQGGAATGARVQTAVAVVEFTPWEFRPH
jgi:Tfp pilus assembly protein PilF